MDNLHSSHINKFLAQLYIFPDLSPNPQLNTTFTNLYNFAISKKEYQVLMSQELRELQSLCSSAECLLEKSVCKEVINSKTAWETLGSFQYYQNYIELSQLEFLNLSFYNPNIHRVLFMGGGSLPLSAIFLAKKYNISCHIIDHDPEAVDLSLKLITSLGLNNLIQISYQDAYVFRDDTLYDACYVAALINGEKYEQNKFFGSLSSRIKARKYLFRSSDGTRELLYKKVNTENLSQYFDIEHIVSPKNSIVNSFIICSNLSK